MHHTGGEGALRHHHILDNFIFLVQQNDLELLALQPREQRHIILGNVAAGAKLYQPPPWRARRRRPSSKAALISQAFAGPMPCTRSSSLILALLTASRSS